MNEPRMTGSGPVVPRGLAERARDISDGRLAPAVPRDAATVILLRQDVSADDGGGVEAFLLRRTPSSSSRRERTCSPVVRWTRATRIPASGGPGPARPISPPCSTCRRTAPGPWCAPRSGRRSRSPACCWPGRRTTTWSATAPRWPRTGTPCWPGLPRSPRCSAAGTWCSAPTCSPRGPAGSRRRPRRAATTPGSSPPPCHPGRQPRRRRRVTRIPGNPSRGPGCGPRRRWRPPGPAR